MQNCNLTAFTAENKLVRKKWLRILFTNLRTERDTRVFLSRASYEIREIRLRALWICMGVDGNDGAISSHEKQCKVYGPRLNQSLWPQLPAGTVTTYSRSTLTSHYTRAMSKGPFFWKCVCNCYVCKCVLLVWIAQCTVMLGSHDRRSQQLFPKMYYYASPTVRWETTLPLKNHSMYVKNNHTM